MPSTSSPRHIDKKPSPSHRQSSPDSKENNNDMKKDKDASIAPTNDKLIEPLPSEPLIPKPTMDDLAQAEQALSNLIARKKAIDKSIAALEANIYALEGNYLEDTQNNGNIIKGFDYYLTGGPAGRTFDRRSSRGQPRWDASERIFSGSSFTFQKALELKQREEMSDEDRAGSPFSNSSGTYRYSSERSIKKKKKLRIDDDD